GAGGAIALSWEDVEQGEHPDASFNVLIHEFVHKIDMGRGDANGCPPFLAAYHQELRTIEWQREFSDAYAHFRNAVDNLEEQLPNDVDLDDPAVAAMYDALFSTLPMDPYAAIDPAEFFAVASEAFFVKPVPLAECYPGIYRLMQLYYGQNTLPNP
ncbi:MAG: zinc-dependent peptidase, partial [Herminiimonas sp.]|nr:zinc-dependent peptidase [Herminiimonas sp.]